MRYNLYEFKNLQTLGEWIKIFRLARDQGQYGYQNGESHFLKFSQTLRCFIRAPYVTFPRNSSPIRPSLIMKFYHTCDMQNYMHRSRDH